MTYQSHSSDIADTQKYWSGWGARRPKNRLTINNYLSAVVLAMSAFLVMATHMA